MLAVAFERKLVLPLLCTIHTAPTTLLIRLLLASHPPSPLGKAMVSLRYETIFSRFFALPPYVVLISHRVILEQAAPRFFATLKNDSGAAPRRISMGNAIISRAAMLENDSEKNRDDTLKDFFWGNEKGTSGRRPLQKTCRQFAKQIWLPTATNKEQRNFYDP